MHCWGCRVLWHGRATRTPQNTQDGAQSPRSKGVYARSSLLTRDVMSISGAVVWARNVKFLPCANCYFGNCMGNSLGLILSTDRIWSSWRLSLEFLSVLLEILERNMEKKNCRQEGLGRCECVAGPRKRSFCSAKTWLFTSLGSRSALASGSPVTGWHLPTRQSAMLLRRLIISVSAGWQLQPPPGETESRTVRGSGIPSEQR